MFEASQLDVDLSEIGVENGERMNIQVNESMQVNPLHGVQKLSQHFHHELFGVLVLERNEITNRYGMRIDESIFRLVVAIGELEALDQLYETILFAQFTQRFDLVVVESRAELDETHRAVRVVFCVVHAHVVARFVQLRLQSVQISRVMVGLDFENLIFRNFVNLK